MYLHLFGVSVCVFVSRGNPNGAKAPASTTTGWVLVDCSNNPTPPFVVGCSYCVVKADHHLSLLPSTGCRWTDTGVLPELHHSISGYLSTRKRERGEKRRKSRIECLEQTPLACTLEWTFRAQVER
uniref:Putative secreted protein n=1 Tax=Anopheles marajoara TaxID=58244 RepID=A0A2M4C7L7_9DIPT